MNKWHIQSIDNSANFFEVVDEHGKVVADNATYYPTAISLYHANLIVTAVNNFNRLKIAIHENNFDSVKDLLQ